MYSRSELENMGLSEKWLAHKPDRTALEQRVLNRMIEQRRPKRITPPVNLSLNFYPAYCLYLNKPHKAS